MNNKKKAFKYILIILSAIIFMPLVSCTAFNISGNTSSTAGVSATTAAESSSTAVAATSTTKTENQGLSEQPDEATFKEYFNELGLGKLPENGSLPVDIKKGDNIFISNGRDQLSIYGDLLKDTKLSNAIYDVNAKKNIRGKVEFPLVMKKGGFAGSEPVTIPAGKYEYKIWIGDKLVGVFPFEVKP